MTFTPRQVQILSILAKANEEMQAGILAGRLHISKRTIFRELKNINKPLSEYKVSLSSQYKKGLGLVGNRENVAKLLDVLEQSEAFDPRNKDERQKKLIALMIESSGIQKISYYSSLLQVSDTTISNDLVDLEKWFFQFNMAVSRRSGYGVELLYEEKNYRKMVLSFVKEFNDYSVVDVNSLEIIKRILSKWSDSIMGSFTPDSIDSLILFLAIAVKRIKKEKTLFSKGEKTIDYEDNEVYKLVNKVSEDIEKEFNIDFGMSERYFLYVFFESRKWQSNQKIEEYIDEFGKGFSLREIVFEMIDVFEKDMAFELKLDDYFIEGLMTHLRPTITRLIHNIPIRNTLLEEIKTYYFEMYTKAELAVSILEKRINYTIPPEEIGLIALHFGGAVVRVNEKRKKRQPVCIGVVCSSGIGITSLISSKLKQHFSRRVNIKILTTLDLKTENIPKVDFIVSTFNLTNQAVPVVRVSAILSDEDFKEIEKLVNSCSIKEKKEGKEKSYDADLAQILEITKEIESILADFKIYYMDDNSTFNEVINKAGNETSKSNEDYQTIINELLNREKLSTQIIPEYKIAFLHCKTRAVNNSKFIIILPKGECFTDANLKGIDIIIVMLINERDNHNVLAISSISKTIFDDDNFLSLIRLRDELKIKSAVEKILNEYLYEKLREIYE